MNLAGIRAGDIVEVDGTQAKGSDGLAQGLTRYYATVVDRPEGGLRVRRLRGGTAFYVRARLVVGHWRKAGRRSSAVPRESARNIQPDRSAR